MAKSELSLSNCIGTHVAFTASLAQTVVGALALEGLAAPQAGARDGLRTRSMNVTPVPVHLTRVRHR